MVIDEINKYRIILASRSPRRQQLLNEIGLRFEVMTREWTEDYPPHIKRAEIALYVASQKAKTFMDEIKENEIVITADTIVWCNDRVLNKPVDKKDAEAILRLISDSEHEVITGVCLLSLSGMKTFSSSTKVTFSQLTDEEIGYYIDNFKPYDKAGAYGIQEWIGIVACSKIEGSYFNVMGLPVEQVYRELRNFISS